MNWILSPTSGSEDDDHTYQGLGTHVAMSSVAGHIVEIITGLTTLIL